MCVHLCARMCVHAWVRVFVCVNVNTRCGLPEHVPLACRQRQGWHGRDIATDASITPLPQNMKNMGISCTYPHNICPHRLSKAPSPRSRTYARTHVHTHAHTHAHTHTHTHSHTHAHFHTLKRVQRRRAPCAPPGVPDGAAPPAPPAAPRLQGPILRLRCTGAPAGAWAQGRGRARLCVCVVTGKAPLGPEHAQ